MARLLELEDHYPEKGILGFNAEHIFEDLCGKLADAPHPVQTVAVVSVKFYSSWEKL